MSQIQYSPSKIIESLNAQIIEIQIRIAETREKGSEWAEGTRLDKIAELRELIAIVSQDI